jgi:5-methylcytosine-specific restriction endonuclease McrA
MVGATMIGMPAKLLYPALPGETERERRLRVMRERQNRKYANDPEWAAKRKANARMQYAKNPERGRANAHAWKLSNPERKLELDRIWAERNPEKSKLIHVNASHRRRAQTASGSVTNAEWCEIKESFGYRCAYCLAPSNRLEMDHVLSLSNGGEHASHNIVPACRSCNARKSNKGVLSMLPPVPEIGGRKSWLS